MIVHSVMGFYRIMDAVSLRRGQLTYSSWAWFQLGEHFSTSGDKPFYGCSSCIGFDQPYKT